MTTIDNVIKNINKKYGDWIATKGCKWWDQIERISSWSVSLDYALWGGYPKWKIIELLWNNGSWKSTLCLMAAKINQDNWWHTLYVDMENALNADRIRSLWLDNKSFISITPEDWNTAINIMQEALDEWVFDLIVWDSIDSSTPRVELQWDSWDSHMWVKAKMINQAMRKLNLWLKGKTTLMITNQYRINIGQNYGDPTVTPWGNWPAYYASQRLLINRQEAISKQLVNGNWEMVWTHIEVRIKKNRFYKPEQRAELYLLYNWTIREWTYVINAFISSWLLRQDWKTFYRWKEKLWIKNRVIEYYASDLDKYKEDCDKLLKEVKEQTFDNKESTTF